MITGQQETAAGAEQVVPAIGDGGESENVHEQAEGTRDTEETEGHDGSEMVEGEAGADELDDLEFAFGRYKVPKKLAEDVRGLQKAFTEKTQAFSKQVRELEARASARAEANEAELTARAQLHHVNQEIKRLETFGWPEYQAARQSDPIGADEAWQYKQHLAQQKTQLEGDIQNHATQRSQEAQQEVAKRFEETREFAVKNIKGWTPKVDVEIGNFAISKGIPPEFIQQNMSPLLYDLLHKAMIGDQLLNKPAAPKPAATTQPAPTTVIGGKASPGARKSLSEMDMDEYAAARSAGRGG